MKQLLNEYIYTLRDCRQILKLKSLKSNQLTYEIQINIDMSNERMKRKIDSYVKNLLIFTKYKWK